MFPLSFLLALAFLDQLRFNPNCQEKWVKSIDFSLFTLRMAPDRKHIYLWWWGTQITFLGGKKRNGKWLNVNGKENLLSSDATRWGLHEQGLKAHYGSSRWNAEFQSFLVSAEARREFITWVIGILRSIDDWLNAKSVSMNFRSPDRSFTSFDYKLSINAKPIKECINKVIESATTSSLPSFLIAPTQDNGQFTFDFNTQEIKKTKNCWSTWSLQAARVTRA